jgi:hypothetical protein
MRSHHSRDLSGLSTVWSEQATKSWPNRVINADTITQELYSLGDKVKTLIDIFMVSASAQTLVLALTCYQLESALSVEPAVDTIRRIVLEVQKEQARVLAALSDKEISESNGMAQSVLV